jgi:hypothetical protein
MNHRVIYIVRFRPSISIILIEEMTHLTVLHLLLIVIGVIMVSTIGYQVVSNVNEAFVATSMTAPTCPAGLTFAGGMGACYDPTNKIKTISPAICPAGSNFVPGQNLCVKGALPPPPNYWVQGVQSGAPAPATTAQTSLTNLVGLSGAPSSGNATAQATIPTCPTGQTYNTVQQMCVSTTPTCPEGQTFDKTQGLCVTNIPAFSTTETIASNKASDSTLLKNIQQIVHNELLSQSGMTTGSQLAFLGQKNKQNGDLDEESPSDYQGKEFARDCPKNTSVPDMSKYVRKDSIPCWGCNLE